jgi:hypothetical protein
MEEKCGLDLQTVSEHSACLIWLKGNAKETTEKIDILMTKLVFGNGKPPIQEQINQANQLTQTNYKALKERIDVKFETLEDKFNEHLLGIKERDTAKKWTFERIISIIAVLVVIYFGYHSMNKNISIREQGNGQITNIEK